MRNHSKYFSFLLLLNFCAFANYSLVHGAETSEKQPFIAIHQWQFLNYTWPSLSAYNLAVNSSQYIPENNAPAGMKIYDNKIFLSVPRLRPGIPTTLAYVPVVKEGTRNNILLNPYPNWKMNTKGDCEALQSVQSMEIDTQGRMWVIDGVRINEETKCPSKLVILDLNNNGRIIHKYLFPNEISLSKGGFLNDLVVDEVDGGFAYITDSSYIDPGLIVYSLKENRSWKLRDASMFADVKAADFKVDNTTLNYLLPIDGIALSPPSSSEEKTLYFCALTALKLYSIPTSILKNESISRTDQWHRKVKLIGEKQTQSDGLVMDSEGNLYYTLLTLNGVGKWDTSTAIENSEIISTSSKMVWPDTFAMDNVGFLSVISNRLYEFYDTSKKLEITCEYKFRISRYFTGTRNYMYHDQ